MDTRTLRLACLGCRRAVTALHADRRCHAHPRHLPLTGRLDHVGLDGVLAEMVIVSAPDGSGQLELTKYHRPDDPAAAQAPLSNRLGFRHIAYAVDDLDGVVERLRAKGLDTVGDIVNYEDTYGLCYLSDSPERPVTPLGPDILDS